MITFDAWKLPDGETHLPEWMRKVNRRMKGRLTYQWDKYETALKFVPRRRVAVDVGAHVGLWSYWMAKHFEHLHAFEPSSAHLECWILNLQEYKNTTLYPIALGDREGMVRLETAPTSSGDTHVVVDEASPIRMATLDSFDLRDVDLIKIDVEGFEYEVAKGAVETIQRERPVVIVEQKGHEHRYYGAPPQQALAYLQSLGMAPLAKPMSGDYVMGWP